MIHSQCEGHYFKLIQLLESVHLHNISIHRICVGLFLVRDSALTRVIFSEKYGLVHSELSESLLVLQRITYQNAHAGCNLELTSLANPV